MVIGMLICEVLEEEMAHILSKDSDIGRVTVVADDPANDMIEALRAEIGNRLTVISDVEDFTPDPSIPMEILATVLRVGLHMDKEDLQEGVKGQAKLLDPASDVLWLGYGLCGNVLLDIERQLEDLTCPIVMPQNADGSKIDDCVCLVLGGTEKYLEHVFKEAGTWFVTPGWLKHWETLLVQELRAQDIPTVKWIFERAAYKRVLKVNTGIEDEDSYRAETEKFAELFDFYVEEAKGTLSLLENALLEAKRLLPEGRKEGVNEDAVKESGAAVQ